MARNVGCRTESEDVGSDGGAVAPLRGSFGLHTWRTSQQKPFRAKCENVVLRIVWMGSKHSKDDGWREMSGVELKAGTSEVMERLAAPLRNHLPVHRGELLGKAI
ncbi:hypothetical protein CEXT_372101 [Caerostris extrusa]|uniref:Uncharacterized protein n=1 Tax=Caerostris extrusa TaxID=172846 RepID=A0AAV4PWP8_CAEEX|nr:hypothetical protein CEXT_372101 [Caerostris extrusa]